MARRRPSSSLLLWDVRPSTLVGLAAGALAVAAATAVIFPLKHSVPAVSTGVIYLLAVLLVSTWFGLWVGLATALASAAAFNWFHIPPTGRLTISDPQNWVALVVFLVVAVIASTLAEVARARAGEAELRRREADLAADLARLLLGGQDVATALPAAGERLAAALDLPSAAIELAPRPSAAPDGSLHLPLAGAGRALGTLRLVARPPEPVLARLRERVVPSLEALLAGALEREALQREVVEAQALRRSDDIKTSLLRAVSHDLRTPLTAIATIGEALASRNLTREERDELAGAVTAEANRLASLVDKLLDLSRLQGGAAAPRPDWCSVEEVLRAAIDETVAPPTGFDVAIDPDLPLIRADAVQLERAFANLLENAVRYGGDYPVAVRARAVGHRLLIRVVDRGPGIAGPELERIFVPFHRAAPATGTSPAAAAAHTGSGLGLAIARGFVEANGGRVWAESLPRQGTTFVVELPLPSDDDDPVASGGGARVASR
ncbi:MAG: integral rane sensor signal transduction histidine kinase [Conexibacter sp.]|nr:integral rane sensor signal transduction histidine kinase [Conexibacter sp.]